MSQNCIVIQYGLHKKKHILKNEVVSNQISGENLDEGIVKCMRFIYQNAKNPMNIVKQLQIIANSNCIAEYKNALVYNKQYF